MSPLADVASTAVTANEQARYARYRRASLVALGVLGVLNGIADVLFADALAVEITIDIVLGLLCAAAVACWCAYDARLRGSRLSAGHLVWLALVGPITVPRYFLRRRSLRLGKALLFALLLYALPIVAELLAARATAYLLGLPT